MYFFLIIAIVVGVALLMRGSERVELPERLPLYVGLGIIIVFGL